MVEVVVVWVWVARRVVSCRALRLLVDWFDDLGRARRAIPAVVRPALLVAGSSVIVAVSGVTGLCSGVGLVESTAPDLKYMVWLPWSDV